MQLPSALNALDLLEGFETSKICHGHPLISSLNALDLLEGFETYRVLKRVMATIP